MWALQSGEYSLNWQFAFGKQLSWHAVEAQWNLIMNARNALDWQIVKAAVFDTGMKQQERHVPTDDLADDGYSTDQMEELMLSSHQLQDDANEERLQRRNDAENADAAVAVAPE